jgi:hypothetical protein
VPIPKISSCDQQNDVVIGHGFFCVFEDSAQELDVHTAEKILLLEGKLGPGSVLLAGKDFVPLVMRESVSCSI